MIERRVRSIIGSEAVLEIGTNGSIEVAPRSEEECSLLLAAAHSSGWAVRLSGNGGWCGRDGPAEMVISTRCMEGPPDLSPADLVLTARAGTSMDDIQATAAREGTWVPLDPPGIGRSLGSVLATGTAGPLRTGYGAVRSRVLGLTFVTADGRIVRVGGRVVKNVAGFDLKSLLVGCFGAFGIITTAHVRLNALPAADLTLAARAPRDSLLRCALSILSSGVTPAAMDLFSHKSGDHDGWTLAVRVVGSEATVAAERKNITAAASQQEFDVLDGEKGSQLWTSASAATAGFAATIRMGCLASELGQALDLLNAELLVEGGSFTTVSVLPGVIRCSCNTTSSRIRNLRELAAGHNWPVTLERAQWEVLSVVGHYGEYRGKVGNLVASLREVFDRRSIFAVPLGGTA